MEERAINEVMPAAPPHVRAGDRVRFRAGRGVSEGTIDAVEGDSAAIRTRDGKLVRRKLATVARVAA